MRAVPICDLDMPAANSCVVLWLDHGKQQSRRYVILTGRHPGEGNAPFTRVVLVRRARTLTG